MLHSKEWEVCNRLVMLLWSRVKWPRSREPSFPCHPYSAKHMGINLNFHHPPFSVYRENSHDRNFKGCTQCEGPMLKVESLLFSKSCPFTTSSWLSSIISLRWFFPKKVLNYPPNLSIKLNFMFFSRALKNASHHMWRLTYLENTEIRMQWRYFILTIQ